MTQPKKIEIIGLLNADTPLMRTEAELVAPETPANLVQRSQTLKKELAELIKAEPESSTTVVRAWLREETTP